MQQRAVIFRLLSELFYLKIHIRTDSLDLRGEDAVFYQRMRFHSNQCGVCDERLHLSACFYFQQSVLAALYSSEGSVMEVNSQPVWDWRLCKYLLHAHSVTVL